jgi:hypothetical protein
MATTDPPTRRDVVVSTLRSVSSVGAYSPPAAGCIVDESWPADGSTGSTYSWQKAMQERRLDALIEAPARRAGWCGSATAREIRTLFIGHRAPTRMLAERRRRQRPRAQRDPVPVGAADDVGDAIRRCVHEVRGAS